MATSLASRGAFRKQDCLTGPGGRETQRGMSWLLLAVGVLGALSTFNVYRPRYRPGWLAIFSFFWGWLTAELALHQIALQVLLVAVLVAEGALRAWPGWLGLGLTIGSWALLWRSHRHAHQAEAAVARGLQDRLGSAYRAQVP